MTGTEVYERARQVRHYVQGEVFELVDACVLVADAQWPLGELSRALPTGLVEKV